jgi:phosphate transporter
VKHVRLLLAVSLGACILSSNLLLHVSPFAHRCLALLCFTIAMWALEAIPYFATALLVPILVVVFQVLEVPTASYLPDHPSSKTRSLC